MSSSFEVESYTEFSLRVHGSVTPWNLRPITGTMEVTRRCTAACDHCCFGCSPVANETMPYHRIVRLIDELEEIPSLRVVVFTGGECFLLGASLYRLVERAAKRGYITRCVTNAYWAVSPAAALARLRVAVRAGLSEINFSTGEFHQSFVPVHRVVNGILAAVELGIQHVVVNVEAFRGSTSPLRYLLQHPDLEELFSSGRVKVQQNVWIPVNGRSKVNHGPDRGRFKEGNKSGCSTVLSVLGVMPDLRLMACCGLLIDYIPDLCLGSLEKARLGEVIRQAPDDFLKIFLHVEGPERILEFVRHHKPDYELPAHVVHPCQTCLHLYRDPVARAVLSAHYQEVKERVVSLFLAGSAALAINRHLEVACLSGAD